MIGKRRHEKRGLSVNFTKIAMERNKWIALVAHDNQNREMV